MNKTKTVSIRLEEELIKEMDHLAGKHHTTKQAILLRFLMAGFPALKKHGKWPNHGDLGLVLDDVTYMETNSKEL